MTIRIGISGWTYKPWRGVFFPKGLPQKREMAYAARTFPSIEVNGTFYGLQKPGTFQVWYDGTPGDFVFAIKASRYITHIRRLRDAGKPLANFFAQGVLALGEKLGPILWQLPPSYRFDPGRLEDFLKLLPHDTMAAARMARRHEAGMKGRVFLTPDRKRPLRHAMEIRHESFRDERFIALLRKYRVGLVVADTVEWPRLGDITADFVYVRLHGSEQLYASGYSETALADWARWLRSWSQSRSPRAIDRVSSAKPRTKVKDIFVYFDNDMKVKAPFDALKLAGRLKVQAGPPPLEDFVTRKTRGGKRAAEGRRRS
ncbi:MAG: DUF72 domain-containing protein [Ferrovibrio sp.]|uniref:DUF72 domain-containing protein n=1 Tax=Ferrovibrio sp. TaxID=1917215 RepID=UPI00261A3F36|nr:DUF72 domain-containing protein [Ferrovibrio sp.]MCW0234497.1 DUF72 domain-containing protein [Ferrovibrio sp.]